MDQEDANDSYPELRRRAEEQLDEPFDVGALSSDELEQLIYELRVHQIELDIQNEQLRTTQMQLERARDRYQALYDAAPVGYVTLDEDGRIRQANRTIAVMLGLPREELTGERLSRFVAAGDQATYHFYQLQLSEKPARENCEIQLVRADGSTFYARLEGRRDEPLPLRGEGDSHRVVISDVTEQAKAHHAVLQAHEHLVQANQALRAEMARRQRLEAELTEVRGLLAQRQDEERRDLARHLHEGAVQDLYGISFHLATLAANLQEETDPPELEMLQEVLRETTRMLRAACYDLQPAAITPFGLAAAIRSDAERFRAEHPDVALHLALETEGPTLPELAELSLFRIYQEAMENVVQHAQAEHAWVRLWADRERVVLEIEDDGCGFEPPEHWVDWARQGRLELLGAMERAAGVDGELEIRTAPGEGTTIRVTVPRPAADPVEA
jgi:PAS domain S-box-containing protein